MGVFYFLILRIVKFMFVVLMVQSGISGMIDGFLSNLCLLLQ